MDIPSRGFRSLISKRPTVLAGALTLVLLTAPTMGGTNIVYSFSHLAGSTGGPGCNDGPTDVARLSCPIGVAIDSGGTLYVADSNNFTIRKITPAGIVSTFAGLAGQSGSRGGVGPNARFWSPDGLSIDIDGNLFVADYGNYTISKITPDGTVSILAGISGVPGYKDGPGSVALFRNPSGTAVDRLGNVYVCDSENYTIRRISSDGTVTTLAGMVGKPGSVDGTGQEAQFGKPTGIVLGSQGELYVTDTTNCTIRRITSTGVVTTFAGAPGQSGSTDGVASNARFSYPRGISIDKAGNLYVGDRDSCIVRQISPTGLVTTVAGLANNSDYADGQGATARFRGPTGTAVDASGNVYVADSWNDSIRRISPERVVSTLVGKPSEFGSTDGTGSAARFWNPVGVAVDHAGHVYVADQYYKDGHIRKVSPTGVVTTIGQGIEPSAIAVDDAGTVYFADHGEIRKIFPSGVTTILAGNSAIYGSADGTGAAAQFRWPSGVAVDGKGNVFVADFGNHTIRKITPAGVVTTMAGAAGVAGYSDGVGAAARFHGPTGIAVTENGDIYVSDTYNYLIRRISADTGMVSTLAGRPPLYGASVIVDGTGTDARFVSLGNIAVDRSGDIFACDYNSIRKITPTGEVTTVGGRAKVAGSQDGVGTEAGFCSPDGVAIDHLGNIYVADTGNNAIRKGVPIASTSRAVNIATRAYCSTGNNVTIGGFVVSGNANKRVLVRAVGPSLTSQGLSAAELLPDPTIEVHDASGVIASNDNWSDNANVAELTSTAATVGATALLGTDTKSAAMLLTLGPGVYSFVVKGNGPTSGVVLLEVYDADSPSTSSTFANIATRAYATTGNGVTIGGFVVSDNAPKHILLRAIGPTLTHHGLGVSEVLNNPVIELHDANNGNAVIASNDNWGDNANAASITATGVRIGATPFDRADTTSAALLLTLPPGVYSFIASGKTVTSGIVLVEVYDAD